MALALDASSVSGTYNQSAANSLTCTTAAFSPPDNSWLYFQIGFNTPSGATLTIGTPTNTGTALTWTLVASQNVTTGGSVSVYRAFNASAQSGITATWTATSTGLGWGAASPSSGYAMDVWTGAAASQTGAAAIGASSTTQTNNIALTTTAANSVEVMWAEDWAQTGTPTTTSPNGETMSATWNIATQSSGGRSRRVAASAGSNNVNWVAGGASPTINYVVYEILEGASAPTINTQPSNTQTMEHRPASFTVSATASGGSLTYQWKDNRTGSFVNCPDGSGATSATYITAPLDVSASGRLYQCVVTDSNGSTTTNNVSVVVVPFNKDPRLVRKILARMNFGTNVREWW